MRDMMCYIPLSQNEKLLFKRYCFHELLTVSRLCGVMHDSPPLLASFVAGGSTRQRQVLTFPTRLASAPKLMRAVKVTYRPIYSYTTIHNMAKRQLYNKTTSVPSKLGCVDGIVCLIEIKTSSPTRQRRIAKTSKKENRGTHDSDRTLGCNTFLDRESLRLLHRLMARRETLFNRQLVLFNVFVPATSSPSLIVQVLFPVGLMVMQCDAMPASQNQAFSGGLRWMIERRLSIFERVWLPCPMEYCDFHGYWRGWIGQGVGCSALWLTNDGYLWCGLLIGWILSLSLVVDFRAAMGAKHSDGSGGNGWLDRMLVIDRLTEVFH